LEVLPARGLRVLVPVHEITLPFCGNQRLLNFKYIGKIKRFRGRDYGVVEPLQISEILDHGKVPGALA
jgi:hypothetical protein